MAEKSAVNSILLAAGSFIGGITVGFLLTPKNGSENRACISEHAVAFSDWMKRRRKIAQRKARIKLSHIRRDVHAELKQNIPDLYEATEHIDLGEQELFRA